MTRMPQVTARELVRFLKDRGFEEERQAGSHLSLWQPERRIAVTIPVHSGIDLGRGLAVRILRTPDSASRTSFDSGRFRRYEGGAGFAGQKAAMSAPRIRRPSAARRLPRVLRLEPRVTFLAARHRGGCGPSTTTIAALLQTFTVFGKAAVLLAVVRPDVAAEIGAVHLDRPAGAAELDVPGLRRHRLTDLVGEHEGRLVLDTQLARQGERALALHLVDKDDDGREVEAQRRLVEGKQRAAGRAEVPAAGLAAPARRAVRPPAVVAGAAATVRADRATAAVGPADRP